MPVPQFGEPQPGVEYVDRPAAFGIAERDGRIALVQVVKPGHGEWLDLPGGALDPGEDAQAAVVREFGEETGLKVRPLGAFARADQYFIKTDGQPVNNRGVFFRLALEGEDAALKIEDDHTLVWLDPGQAVVRLRHDAHAWAVAAWLRRGQGA
jgi:8-oxo-dGTP diphosphatase